MKRLFSLLMFCLLLLVSAAALAAPYGVHPYIRADNKGNANASLFLFYTQSGVFVLLLLMMWRMAMRRFSRALVCWRTVL